ncbi:hypothetical protein [Candidatus Cyanaurora vandensis]|uniref:hypothetical protein n=1 Tax=Candidatus Cyanaurora vandensis TaxID=2714958 RepID=UPI00257A4886|nr:hypothetical protein [Candidatus Cyanaurora vandensis]
MSTLTQTRPRFTVQPLDLTVLAIKLSPRVLVIRNTHTDKDVTYFGFDTFEEAVKLREWMNAHQFGPYNRVNDAGTNKPRKAERLPQAWEMKVHRCPTYWIEQAVKRDLERTETARIIAAGQAARHDLGL